MLCPGTQNDCDNPGCRHGGCQGRRPMLPLFQSAAWIRQAEGPDQPANAPLPDARALSRAELAA